MPRRQKKIHGSFFVDKFEALTSRAPGLCPPSLYGGCVTGMNVLTRANHGDEIPERDVTYHLTCLLIYHGTTTHL